MPDASYDAVIVGAGHNGLCLAAYLARAGLKVAMFERRHDEGGGAHTDEATVSGFWHNLLPTTWSSSRPCRSIVCAKKSGRSPAVYGRLTAGAK